MRLSIICHKIVVLALAFLFLLTAACSTSNEDIDRWAESLGGEQKIITVLSDYAIPLETRVYSVLKLVEKKKFGALSVALEGMTQTQKIELIKASAPEIIKMLRHVDLDVQASAKDVLYVFMSIDQEVIQKSARQVIIQWYSTEFMKKLTLGHFSAFHVLSEIGPLAGDLLVEQLVKTPKARKKIVRIIEKIDSPGVSKHASDVLLKWFEEQKPDLSAELLDLACFVRNDNLTAVMNEYILNKKNPIDIRFSVFNTLTFHPSVTTVPAAVKIFIDRTELFDMRTKAIDIILKLGDESLLDYLYPFLKDEDVKWSAFAAILKFGGAKSVNKVFKKLNPKVKFWREDYDVARRSLKQLDKEAAEPLARYAKSKYVPLATLAIIGLQYTADLEFAEKILTPLTKDKRVIKNYFEHKDYTIGMMASQVLSNIKNEI